jgi:AcrR family transcriptional regulator
MAERGAATRAKLIAATQDVVREVGYAHATTRAIAEAAGVAEGTIYRHFPDKVALYFAAALEQDSALISELASLPEKARSSETSRRLFSAWRPCARRSSRWNWPCAPIQNSWHAGRR